MMYFMRIQCALCMFLKRIKIIINEVLIMVKPLYIKGTELSHIRSDTGTQLCMTSDRIQPSSAAGAQKIRGIWHL